MGTDPGTNSSTQHGGGGEGKLIKLWYNINIIPNDSTTCILCIRRHSFLFSSSLIHIIVRNEYCMTTFLGITLFHRIEATDTHGMTKALSREQNRSSNCVTFPIKKKQIVAR
mmetsp:Transcript_31407/g.35616  ORF Transcript_31407/g.35616 Transcript_31407/m.35616 type:complete len:112 (+) Transcript_31407:1576-1911(+)